MEPSSQRGLKELKLMGNHPRGDHTEFTVPGREEEDIESRLSFLM